MYRHKSHFSDQHYKGVTSGPFPFLNPTVRRSPVSVSSPPRPESDASDEKTSDKDDASPRPARSKTSKPEEIRATEVDQKWRARDNRKGRHAICLVADDNGKYMTPPATNTFGEVIKGVWRMVSVYPYWDVSYLVAVIFTLGSVVWVLNAFFVWLPLQDPSTEFPGEETTAGGITAFMGATIFEIGSIFLMIEAVNENRSDCFGWAVEEALEENGLIHVRPGHNCKHHHRNKRSFLGYGTASEDKSSHDLPMEDKSQPTSDNPRTWTWLPTWHELSTHYIYELGFLACAFQMAGATIFWISGFTALPGIYQYLSPAALNGAYWSVQVIGGSGFIISSTFFMLETQQKWYLPAPQVLGWHIGVWNLIGAIGFTLCGCLGFSNGEEEIFQSSLATFWGSWAFLIGSTIQWYESLDKHPVEVEQGGGRIADTQPVHS